ncbi:hypothetical protein [Nitrospina watsonii]|uniref:Bacteriophage T4 Gp32 single-stranded DNA-binding domain-containing protein n=1 Tax=Nitrospina watsonii TaxID=1323948 RepID=A0ABM9HH41_9BACT|nr:hypothetical protein [Nitrospina watsonii]CAI2719327.1 conserved protein of unknown function [Nitrospina watsonii]
MPVNDSYLDPKDRAYAPAKTEVVMVRRQVSIDYKKTYGGISPYINGIMGGTRARLLFTFCENAEGHDFGKVLRFQVPRTDCPECYGRTEWAALPGETRFFIDTLSTAVELAGISFKDRLPVTVAWVRAHLPDTEFTELDTLVAGMVDSDDYKKRKRGDELRPVFRDDPIANFSDVMWVLAGTPRKAFPEGYVASKHYPV